MSVSSSGGSYAELLASRLRRAQAGEVPPDSPGGPGSVGSAKEERTTLHESWLKKKRTGVFTSWQRRYFLLVLTRSDLASRGATHSRCSLEYYGACGALAVWMPDVDARRRPYTIPPSPIRNPLLPGSPGCDRSPRGWKRFAGWHTDSAVVVVQRNARPTTWASCPANRAQRFRALRRRRVY